MTDPKPIEIQSIFISRKQYKAVPTVTLEQHVLGQCEAPYKYPSFDDAYMVGRGIGDNAEAVVLVVIADTPAKRVQQLRDAGEQCNACHDLPPDRELSCLVTRSDGKPVKAVVYICDRCKEIAAHSDGNLNVDVKRTIADIPKVARPPLKLIKAGKGGRNTPSKKTVKAIRKSGRFGSNR